MKKSSEDPLKPEDKLEWVTPKISLMEADDTAGKRIQSSGEGTKGGDPYAPS